MSDNKRVNAPEADVNTSTANEVTGASVSIEAPEVLDKDELVEMSDRFHVVMSKPYKFEGKEYKSIDLTPLQDMTAEDFIAVNRYLERSGIILATPQPETTMEVTLTMAARATKMPIEFFNSLPLPEAIKVKNRVAGFFYGVE